MQYITLDKFKELLYGGDKSLSFEYKYINELNIFPVPDGDTGINMKMTSNGGVNSLNDVKLSDLKQLSDMFCRNLLFNARGNSGVIFSQIMKGFCVDFKEGQTQLTVKDLINSFHKAKEYAYKAVQNPIEGTILTIVRRISEEINNQQFTSIIEFFNFIMTVGKTALEKTKETLPELKSAGVVDSGAYGLMSYLGGMNAVLNNCWDDYINKLETQLKAESNFENNFLFNQEHDEDAYGYCSEIILKINSYIHFDMKNTKKKFNKEKFDEHLRRIGDSIVSVQDGDILKIHIHTFKPDQLLKLGQKYGEFEKIKIENMTNQYLERLHNLQIQPNQLKEELFIIFTSATVQMAKMIYELIDNCNVIITENNSPSIKDFILYIKQAKSKNILLIIDNSDYEMAAKQAIQYFDKKINICLINSKSFINTRQLISELPCETNIKLLEKECKQLINNYLYAMITVAAKDDPANNVYVDDKFAVIDKNISCVSKTYFDCLCQAFNFLFEQNKDACLCTIIYGANASNKTIEKFSNYVEENYGVMIDVKFGNQIVYTYYIGLT